jgi:hypothetical protein
MIRIADSRGKPGGSISNFFSLKENLKMKKSLLAAMIVAFGVVACGKKEEAKAPAPAPAPAAEQKPAEAAPAQPAAPTQPAAPAAPAPAQAPKK